MDFAWNEGLNVVVITLSVLILFLFVITLWIGLRVGKMRKRYMHMMNSPNLGDLEEAIISLQDRVKELERRNTESEQHILHILDKLKIMKANIGIVRYNAFEEQGNQLSFSIAIIDEYQTGIVLSGIYGREHTYVFSKSIEKGVSGQVLTPEEKEAINKAQSSFKTGNE